MCGFCGIVDWAKDGPTDISVLKCMVNQITHRGPDEYGILVDGSVGLGHTRLSVVDLSGGSQPMANEDETLWIVFNGEIYNHVELRPDLENRGHRFSTSCDTECIVHLYEEYGERCLEYLNGQFAFVIWDRVNSKVFMARDRLGVRPLYYSTIGKRLLFASEVKSLFAVPGVSARIDPLGLDQTFTFWSPQAPRTAFEGISQIPPAHYAIGTEQAIRTFRYWDFSFPTGSESTQRVEADYVQQLRELLLRSISLRMRADVPVGAYLSGGLDSSLVTAMISQCTDAALHTFSIRFEDAAYDESEQQDLMTRRLATQHDSITISHADIARAFADVVWHAEAPLLRTAPAPLHLLSQLVREHGIKVVVTGEGADEMFAGYHIFKENRLRRLWARYPDSAVPGKLLSQLYPYIQTQHTPTQAFWRQFFAHRMLEVDHPCYSHLVRWDNTSALKRFFSAELRQRIGAYDCAAEFASTLPPHFGKWGPLAQAQYIETTTFMSNYLLSSQGDRVGMSHGVECRFPFLDHHVVEFASRIPSKFKLRGLEEKYVLRQVANEFLPAEVRQRPKRPYRAPNSASFFCPEARDVTRELTSESSLRDSGYFEPTAVARFVGKCAAMDGSGVSARNDMLLLGVLSTQLLHHRFVRGTRMRGPLREDMLRVRVLGPLKGRNSVLAGGLRGA